MYGTDNYTHDTTSGRGNEFMIGLLCGTAVGAAIGMLLAPKSGAELRSKLAESADRLRRRANETYAQASHAVSDMVEEGRTAVKRGREKFDEARTAFNEQAEDVRL